MGSAVRNSGQLPGLRGQTASSLSECPAALILTSMYWKEARNTGKLWSLKFHTEKEMSLEKCKGIRSAVHFKKALQVKFRLSLLRPTLTTYDLALSVANEERERHLWKAVLFRDGGKSIPLSTHPEQHDTFRESKDKFRMASANTRLFQVSVWSP